MAKDTKDEKLDDKAAADQKAASTEGAQSVADAVKRVADAAVAEVQKFTPDRQGYEFNFSGTKGGRFVITGPNNLASGGTVMLNGKQLETTAWGTSLIEGKLPADSANGQVLVIIDRETIRKGFYKA